MACIKDIIMMSWDEFRLDSVQAAVLNAKLPHLDSYNKARQDSARKYSIAFENCSEIITPAFSNGCSTVCSNCHCHVFHQYTKDSFK